MPASGLLAPASISGFLLLVPWGQLADAAARVSTPLALARLPLHARLWGRSRHRHGAGATDTACGRAGATARARSAGGRRDPGRAAWDWECGAGGRAGSRSFLWRPARARRAREPKSDQDQAIEIPSFLPRRTGDNRPDQAVGNQFHG